MPLSVRRIRHQHRIIVIFRSAEIEPACAEGRVGIIFSVKHGGIFARALEKDILIVDKSEISRLTSNGHVRHIIMLRIGLFGGDIPYRSLQFTRADKTVGVVFAVKPAQSINAFVNSNVCYIDVVALRGSYALDHIKSQKRDNIPLKALGGADILSVDNNIVPIAIRRHVGGKLIILACGWSRQ